MVNNNLLSKNNKQFQDCLTSIHKIPNSVDTRHAEESDGDPTTQNPLVLIRMELALTDHQILNSWSESLTL